LKIIESIINPTGATKMSGKTFEQFVNEDLRDRIPVVIKVAEEFLEERITCKVTGATAGDLKIATVTFFSESKYGKTKKHQVHFVYDEEAKHFIKAQVTKKHVKRNKVQLKNPITLDNYEFLGEKEIGIKGLSKPWRMWKLVGSSYEVTHSHPNALQEAESIENSLDN
jgi:hypothetical protein